MDKFRDTNNVTITTDVEGDFNGKSVEKYQTLIQKVSHLIGLPFSTIPKSFHHE
ncbi:MAG: hypothetical protein GY827_09620 [Cytophagales bacterium]|nr:hypothetical protein [Cytophagales bacterium]